MIKFSVAMVAALAAACGGGGKKPATTDTARMDGSASTPTEGATEASSQTPPPKEEAKQAPPPPEPPRKVMKSMTPDELKWNPLVPEAGDKGPMVASLWGDMMNGPNGFMIKLPAGDKGMLHTHTNDYHAIGITASSASQDGGKTHAVPQGTYWFQPGGTAHFNACPGKTPCIGFAHFNAGKFDFAPAKPAKGAKPDARAVEKPLKSIKWIPFDEKNPKGAAFAPLWGDMKAAENGMYFKIPAGSTPFWHIHKNDYHAVVLAGTVQNIESGKEAEAKDMPVGSYWYQPGGNKHTTNCKAGAECIVYCYFTGAFDAVPAQ